MFSKSLVAMYVNSLTFDQARELAARYGYQFTSEEAEIILPFLKEHRFELDLEHKDYLLNLARPSLSRETLAKVEKMIDELIN